MSRQKLSTRCVTPKTQERRPFTPSEASLRARIICRTERKKWRERGSPIIARPYCKRADGFTVISSNRSLGEEVDSSFV